MGLKVKLQTKTPCECILTGHADRENLDQAYEKVYAKLSKEITLPGFRKGCAPRELVETKFRDYFQQEAIEDIMSGILRSVIKKQNLRIAGSIHSQEEYDFPTEGDFDFTIEFEVHPVVKLDNVKGIKLVKKAVKVGDKDIETTIQRLCENYASFVDVESERPAQFGDWLVVDYSGVVDGEDVLSRDDAWIEVNSQMQHPVAGFAEQLVDKKAGETCTFSVTAPPDHYLEKVKGKSIDFTVKVKELNEKKIPELTDELAAKIDPECTTAGQLRDKVRKNYAEYREQEEQNRLRQLAREKLAELHPLPLPPSEVHDRAQRVLQRMAQERIQQGDDEETIKNDVESMQKTAEDEASRTLRAEYILSTLAARENIPVYDEDIIPQIEYYARSFRRSPKAIYEQFKRDGYIPVLLQEARENKALEWVIEHADIQEKS